MIGRITCLNGGNYTVSIEDSSIIECRCCGKLRSVKLSKESSFNFSKNKNSKKLETNTIKLSPKVGDFVDVSIEDKLITEVLPRKNEMIRPDIANVDQILLICSAKEPDFSYLLLDLFLVNIEKNHIKPVIIISKMDLLNKEEYDLLVKNMAYYQNLGYQVIFVNSKSKINTNLVADVLAGKVTVLTGQTGAGKSSLINSIIPGFKLDTQEISKALGRGKHTTRVTNLYSFNGGYIGDTPGFSKIDLDGIDEKELSRYFIEFAKYPCKFSSCLHSEGVLGCGIRHNSEILSSRYENYLRLLEKVKR